MSASEMPAATTAKPPVPASAMAWKARMMPSTVPKSPMNGAAAPMVPSTQRFEPAPCTSSKLRSVATRSSSGMGTLRSPSIRSV